MELSDMLDVFHYYFEEDSTHKDQEESAYADAFRSNLYQSLYNKNYKYGVKDAQTANGMDGLDGPLGGDPEPLQEEKVKVFSPRAKEAKPYVAPTEFSPDSINPFGSVLDAPIN